MWNSCSAVSHWHSLINEFMWTVRENVQLPMGSAWTSMATPYFMRSGGRDEGVMGDTSLFLNLVNKKKKRKSSNTAPQRHHGSLISFHPRPDWAGSAWGSQWSNAKEELESCISTSAAFVPYVDIWRLSFLFLVLWGNPSNGIEMARERQRELNVLPPTTTTPQ